jgi:TPR repeat protein
MYTHGLGVPKDDSKVFELYSSSAAKGSMVGLRNLAFMYAEGKGTAQNEAKAAELYDQGAKMGDSWMQ